MADDDDRRGIDSRGSVHAQRLEAATRERRRHDTARSERASRSGRNAPAERPGLRI